MAGAAKIVERILADAKNEAAAIKGRAGEQAAEIKAKAETDAQKDQERILAQAQDTAQERRRRILTIAELDGRKALLGAKEALLEEAFAQALKELVGLDTPAYQQVVRSLLLESVQTGTEEVIIAPGDQNRITPGFLAEVNQQLGLQGKTPGLTLATETRHLEGGFVLRAGGMEINNSFAALLKMQRDELEPEVAAILFTGEGGGLGEGGANG